MQQPHLYSVVKYETPSARASQAAGTAATGFMIALGLAVVPILVAFLSAGTFNRTALIAMATAVGVAALSVVATFLIKLQQARSNDVPPTVTPGQPVAPAAPLAPIAADHGVHVEGVLLPEMPILNPELVVALVERTLRESLTPPVVPPA